MLRTKLTHYPWLGHRGEAAKLAMRLDVTERSLTEDDLPVRDAARLLLAKRVLLAAGTAFLAVNLWTGAPLFALWVGSQTVGQKALSMGAVFVVVIVLAVLVGAMVFAMVWLDAAYNRLTGRKLRENRLTWLRSMNAQGETVSEGVRANALENIVMASVYLAVVVFVVWFFFFAGSPLPGR